MSSDAFANKCLVVGTDFLHVYVVFAVDERLDCRILTRHCGNAAHIRQLYCVVHFDLNTVLDASNCRGGHLGEGGTGRGDF